MTTTENSNLYLSQLFCGIDLLEMTTIENDDFSLKQYMLGIYLLKMTAIENSANQPSSSKGIYLLNMTTIVKRFIVILF